MDCAHVEDLRMLNTMKSRLDQLENKKKSANYKNFNVFIDFLNRIMDMRYGMSERKTNKNHPSVSTLCLDVPP